MRRAGPIVVAALAACLALPAAPARAGDEVAQLDGMGSFWTASAPASFSVARRGEPADPPCGKTWESPVDGTWNDGAKWDPDGMPNQVRACLPASATPYTVTVPNAQMHNLAGLTIGAGATLRLSGNSASMNAINDIINRGKIEIHDGGQLYGSVLTNEGTLEDTGTANPGLSNFTGGIDNFGIVRANQRLNLAGGNSAIVNRPGATMEAAETTSILSLALNAGSVTFDGTVTNDGVVNVFSFGTFTLGAVTHTGNVITTSSPSFQTLIPSGTGNARVRTAITTDLGGDIGANMTVLATATAGSSTNLRLTADRTNNGTLVLDSETNGEVQVNSEGAPRRLTNAKNLDVKAGTGGGRNLRTHLTNTSTGDIDIDAGTTLSLDGAGDGWSHTTAGAIDIAATGAMNVFGFTAASFTQTAGTITVNGSFAQVGGRHVHQAGTVAGRITLVPRGGALPLLDPSGTGNALYEVRNGATLGADIPETATVVVRGAPGWDTGVLNLNGDRTNRGTLRLESDNDREVHLRSDGSTPARKLTNEATLELVAGGHRELSLPIVNEGTAEISENTQTLVPGEATVAGFTNSGGTVEVAGGWRTWGGYVQTSGTTTLLDGTIHTPRNAGRVDIQGGVLRGRGQIGGSLRNDGEVAPGTPTQRFGRISLYDVAEHVQSPHPAAYEQTADGVLSVDINGTTPATQHDQLDVDGPLTLAGTLEVENAAGFAPDHAIPDRFRVIDAESRTGTFSDVVGPDADNYEVEYVSPAAGQAHVELEAIEPPPPPVRMSVGNAETTEGDAGTKSLAFTVSLNQASESTVTADWVTVDDSAVAPSDYVAVTNGTVSFDPGQTQKTINVTINGDATPEAVESFLVRLRNPNENARLGVARATGRILSDDFAISSVRPGVAGDQGSATLTIRGGGFVAGSTVAIERTGSPSRDAEVLDVSTDRSRIVARVDLTGATTGLWDVVVSEPGEGGDSATADDALQVVAGSAPRFSVNVSGPHSQRFGWAGRATISIRNEGTNDAGIDLVRILGTDVELSLEGETAFVPGPLDVGAEDLAEIFGGNDVIPPGEARRLVVRFKSTTLVPHAGLRVDAEVYPAGHLGAVIEGLDPDAPQGEIRGRVVDAAGDGVAGATVSAVGAGLGAGRTALGRSDGDGRFTLDGLADGTFVVGTGPRPEGSDAAEQVTIGPADRSPSVTLTTNATELAGTVRRPDGARVAGAEVWLMRGGDILETTESDGAGGFRFTALRSGDLTLIAQDPAGLARTPVTVEAGVPQLGLRLTTGDRTAAVTVTGPGGPVTGARVALRADGAEAVPLRKRTGAGGTVSFTGLPAGDVTVDAIADGLAPATEETTLGTGTTPVGVALADGGTIEGTITGPDGALPDAVVTAVHTPSGGRQRGYAGASGDYALTSLAAGPHVLWFTAPGLAPKRIGGITVTSGGTQDVDALLTDAGTVQWLALGSDGHGSVPGALFTLRDPATGVQLLSAFADGDGHAEIGPLPPGDYEVDVRVPGARPVTHAISVGSRRRRELPVPGNLHEVPPSPTETIPQPSQPVSPLDRPPRRTIFGLEEPQMSQFQRDGRHLENLSVDIPFPCPQARQIDALISRRSRAFTRAWESYYQAWENVRQNDRADVNLYLGKTAEFGTKLTLTLATMTNGGLNPAGAGTEYAGLNALVNIWGSAAQADAAGQPVDYKALADNTKGILDTLQELDHEFGAEKSGALDGPANIVAIASAIDDFFKLKEELDKFPDDVKNRGNDYLREQGNYQKLLLELNDLLNRLYAEIAKCPDPDPEYEPMPAPGGSGGIVIDNVAPNDPNDIQGPAGVGAERWIPRGQDLPYTIRFENVGPGSDCLQLDPVPPECTIATAPAVLVRVTHVLDDDIDLDAVELGDVGWGDVLVPVPPGLQSYHADVPQADGDLVRVDGALDTATRTISWRLETIDPATGEPQTDADAGFLPPEDGEGAGQGFVAFGARGEDDLAHATEIDAQASIVFDLNPAIQTPEHTNTIDAIAPQSAVASAVQPDAAGAGCVERLDVQWAGTDQGSGVQHYDVWVATDGGAFEPWITATSATSAPFAGEGGHEYAFRSVARDRTGLDELPPATADVTQTIAACDEVAPQPLSTVDGPDAQDGWYDGPVGVGLFAIDDAGGGGVSQLTWSATGAKTGGATVGGDETTIAVADEGVTELSYGATDAAGNAATPRTLTIRIDTRAPTIAIATPGDGARYTVGQAVTPSFTCDDAGIGVRSCTAGGIDTSSAGTRTFTVTAVDELGHTATLSRDYTVVPAPSGGTPPSETPRPVATPPRPLARRFRARPVLVTLGRLRSSRSLRLTLRNAESFALTGRARLQRRSGRRTVALSGRKAFALRSRGRATLTITLNRAARQALRNGRRLRAVLTLELRAGAARTTVTQAITLRVRRR